MKAQKYVVGFLFSPHETHLALIQKNRPAWQAGKYNGIGGSIEEGETPLDAMVREFQEEAGVRILAWEHRVTIRGKGWELYVFCTHSEKWSQVKSMTDEVVVFINPDRPEDYPCLPNLRMLIAICRDRSGVKFPIEMQE